MPCQLWQDLEVGEREIGEKERGWGSKGQRGMAGGGRGGSRKDNGGGERGRIMYICTPYKCKYTLHKQFPTVDSHFTPTHTHTMFPHYTTKAHTHTHMYMYRSTARLSTAVLTASLEKAHLNFFTE